MGGDFMKKIIFMLITLLLFVLPCQANEQIINSFKDMTGKIVSEIQTSYNNKDFVVIKFDKWRKFRFDCLDYGIDIVKSDSILNPYIGYLDVSYKHVGYSINGKSNFNTKEEAELANDEKIGYSTIIRYIYKYNGEWIFVKEQSYNEIDEYFEDTSEQYQPLKRLLVKELWKNKI